MTFVAGIIIGIVVAAVAGWLFLTAVSRMGWP